MSNVLSRLDILMTADSSQMRQEMQDAADETEKSTDRIIDSAKNMAGAVAAAFTVDALITFVNEQIDAAIQMDNMAKAVGSNAQELQRWQVVARGAGVEADAVADAMSTLNEKILEQATGGDTFLKSLGIDALDAAGNLRSADAVMRDLAKSYSAMSDGAAKSAISADIMGDAGMALIPILNQGADAIERQMKAAEDLGLVIDQQTILIMRQFKADMAATTQVIDATKTSIAVQLMPTLSKLSQMMADFAKQSDSVKIAVAGVDIIFKVVGTVAASVGGIFEVVGRTLGKVGAAVWQFVSMDFKGAWQTISDGGVPFLAEIQIVGNELGATLDKIWSDVDQSAGQAEKTMDSARNAALVARIAAENAEKPKEKKEKKEKTPEAILDLGGVMAPVLDPTQEIYDYFSRVSSAVLVGAVQVTDAQAQARGIMQADGTVAWLPKIEPDVIESNQSSLLQLTDLHVSTTAITADAWHSMYEQIKADRFGFDQQLSMSAIQGLEAQREQINQRSMFERLFYRQVDAEAKARIDADLQREREKLEQKKLLLTQEYNDKMSLIQTAAALELASESETKQAMAVLDQQFADQKRMLKQQELDEHMRTVNMSKDFFVNGLNAMAGSNDKAAKAAQAIAKATAIQKVITDTPAAAMGAYNAVVGIPFIGPALAPVAAAAAYAFGALQIRNITSGGKSASGASAPSIPSAPATPNAPAVPDVKKPEPVTRVALDPDRFFTGRMLVDAMDDVFGDGYVPKNIQFVLGGA